MKTLSTFIRRRPIVAMVLTAVLISMIWIDLLAYLAFGFGPELVWYPLFAVMVALCIWIDRRLVALIVAASLLFTVAPSRAEEPEPLPALIIAVVVVVAIGVVIGVRIARKCERIANQRGTNLPPEEFRVAGDPDYAACFSYEEPGLCYAARGVPKEPTVFTMRISVLPDKTLATTLGAQVGWRFTQGWDEFQQESAEHGLDITDTASFSRNRHPCDAEQVPVSFDSATRTVTLGSGGVLVEVERSSDLRDWEPWLKVNAATGTTLEVSDAREHGQAFYRVKTTSPSS